VTHDRVEIVIVRNEVPWQPYRLERETGFILIEIFLFIFVEA